MTALGVVLGGAVGAVVRWLLGRLNRAGLPLGTLTANVAATAVLAWARDTDHGAWLTVGLLGAASTWSTFAVEVADFIDRRDLPRAIAYVVVTIVGGVLAAMAAG